MKTHRNNVIPMIVMTFLIATMTTGRVSAQSYSTSSLHHYLASYPKDSTIVRSWNDTVIFTCSHIMNPSTQQGYSHVFDMRKSLSSSAKEALMPYVLTYVGTIIDQINDFRVCNNKCYFCGRRLKPTSMETFYTPEGYPYSVYTYDTIGFMGYYSFDNDLNPTSNFIIRELPKVKGALRMAVRNTGYYDLTYIELVCQSEDAGHITCLAEMSNSTANPDDWNYSVAAPIFTNDTEILTDVAMTESFVYLASVFKGRDSVGFRYSKIKDYPFTDPIPPHPANDLCLYSLKDFSSPLCPNGITRRKRLPVRLSPHEEGVVAAFSGTILPSNGNIVDPNHRSVFLLDWEEVCQLHEFQVIRTGLKPKVKELASLTGKNSVAVLLESQNHFTGVTTSDLIIPTWGAVSVGGMYNDTLLYKSDGELQSTDSYKGHSVALSGIRSADQLSADAVQRQYDRSNSCLDLHGTEQIYREPVLKSVSKERKWVIYHVKIPTEIEDMPLTAPLSIHTTFCLH